MNKLSTILCFSTFLLVTNIQTGYAQADTSQMPPPPVPVQQNVGFDVIIKVNGEILHGLVKEVGPYYIMYKRTDIPDGPVYSIPRNEVYAISYRNQVKEYFNQEDYNNNISGGLQPGNPLPYPNINYRYQTFTNGNASIGLGFIRSYSKVKDIKSYSSSSAFPVILFAYDADFRNSVRLGVQMGFGGRNFSTQQFSSYDSTINNIKLKENIFGLYVYGRYSILKSSSRFQPYIMGGLGITSSNIKSENLISFTNDNSQQILVKSGARSTGIGIMARVGTQYFISNQLQAFVDAGVGLSVLSIGISIKPQ